MLIVRFDETGDYLSIGQKLYQKLYPILEWDARQNGEWSSLFAFYLPSFLSAGFGIDVGLAQILYNEDGTDAIKPFQNKHTKVEMGAQGELSKVLDEYLQMIEPHTPIVVTKSWAAPECLRIGQQAYAKFKIEKPVQII